MPVNELVRLVRVYSTPWEEKSAALKKLHEDYESNQRQLNIAIKRLKLVETQVDIMLFLKLFCVLVLLSAVYHILGILNMNFYRLFQNNVLLLSNVKHLNRGLSKLVLQSTNCVGSNPTEQGIS